jgi:hypothetical protein
MPRRVFGLTTLSETLTFHTSAIALAKPGSGSSGTINGDLVNVQKIPDSDMEDGY